MKTLIFHGSARKNGHTSKVVNLIADKIPGEIEIIHAYDKLVKPCIACGYCNNVKGCSIKDEMQDYYKKIDDSDNIIVVSPIYCLGAPAPLKLIIDRTQVYWNGKNRGDDEPNSKKGAYVLIGGSPSFKTQFDGSKPAVKEFLRCTGCKVLAEVFFPNSDRTSIENEREILENLKKLIAFF